MKQHVNIAIDTSFNVLSTLKKYSTIKHSLFNYWSLLFYNKYIYYFFNCFLKQGKKSMAIKLVYLLLMNLKKKTMISPILVLQSALLNYRHILKLNIIQYRRKKIFSYILLSLNKQVKISIKYLAAQFASFNLSTSKYSLVDRLSIFILNLFFRTPLIYGRFLQHSAQVHKLIQENKKGFRRKKKKYKKRRRKRWWKLRRLSHRQRRKFFVHKSLRHLTKAQLRRRRKEMMEKYYLIYPQDRIRNRLKRKRKRKVRRRMRKSKKRLNIITRRIRKVLIRSIRRPLRKRRFKLKKRKNIEYKNSIRNLYLDTSNSVDMPLLEDLNICNNFFIHSIAKIQSNSFYFYLLFGKWYKVLEYTYANLTSSFWHLYNLRSRFLRHHIYSNALTKQIAPKIQNVYVKYLIKYLNNTQLLKDKIMNITSVSSFVADPILSANFIKLLKIKKQNKVVKSSLRYSVRVKKSNFLNKQLSKKTYVEKYYCIRNLLRKKSLRFFLKSQQLKEIKSFSNKLLRVRFLKLIRTLYLQKNMKIGRARYSVRTHLFSRLKRIFFLLVRYKLIRLVWFSLRAISLRRTKPLRIHYRRVIANKAFLIKN
jgi:ribosomal protein S7